MSIQLPLHRIFVMAAENRHREPVNKTDTVDSFYNPTLHVTLKVDDVNRRIMEMASCAAEEGLTDCKKKWIMNNTNGIILSVFKVKDTPKKREIRIIRSSGQIVGSYTSSANTADDNSGSKISIITIPHRWWYLLSPHMWLNKMKVVVNQ